MTKSCCFCWVQQSLFKYFSSLTSIDGFNVTFKIRSDNNNNNNIYFTRVTQSNTRYDLFSYFNRRVTFKIVRPTVHFRCRWVRFHRYFPKGGDRSILTQLTSLGHQSGISAKTVPRRLAPCQSTLREVGNFANWVHTNLEKGHLHVYLIGFRYNRNYHTFHRRHVFIVNTFV